MNATTTPPSGTATAPSYPRLHRGTEHARLERLSPYSGQPRRRARRHGPRLRQAAALHLHGTDQGPPGEGGTTSTPVCTGCAAVRSPPPAATRAAWRPRPHRTPCPPPGRPGGPGGGYGYPPAAAPAAPHPCRPRRHPADAPADTATRSPRAASSPRPHPRAGGRTRHWIEINGTRHQISRATLVLGRSTEADVRIDDLGVSRRHCEIRTGTPSTIQDLGSTNGIVVDGQHTTRAALRDGSRIVVGSTTVIYRQAEGVIRGQCQS